MSSARRKQQQGGQEFIEFAFVLVLFVMLFMGAFITGITVIRSTQASQACRDLADMYIHGADFSTYPMQQLADRLTHGLDLQIGSSFSGNNAANTSNSGNVLITVTNIMYVGTSMQANCQAVGASRCTNQNSYVFLQRIRFGNGSLASKKPSLFGDPSTSAISSAGMILNPVTDSGAKLPASGQSMVSTLWKTPLQDGQVAYAVELYAQSPDLTLGSFSNQGVYARYFF